MDIKKLTTLVLCLLSVVLSAQTLKPFKAANGKYGYQDETEKEVITPKYESAREFSEGFAPVKLNDKWGFINKTGKEVVPMKYDNIDFYGFKDGLAVVQLNKKSGVIDKTGKEIVPIKYTYVFFKDSVTRVGSC